MRLNIDIDKSIDKQKLIPKSRLKYFSDFFMFGFIALALLIVMIGMLNDADWHIDTSMAFGIVLYLIIFSFGFYQLYVMDRFIHIDNKNGIVDIQTLKTIARDNKWSISKHDDNMIILQTNPKYLHNRQITVLLDWDSVFINVMSFGKYDLKSPIYFSKDGKVLKYIIQAIDKKENNAT
jgi:hypothetical protein